MFNWSSKRDAFTEQVQQKLRAWVAAPPNSQARKELVAGINELFLSCPSIIYKCYNVNGTNGTALHIFLREGESLESIKSLCHVCPNLSRFLRVRDTNYDLPLHVACQYSTAEIIEYILKKTPKKALRQSNSNGYLPSANVLLNNSHPIPLSTIQKLLQHYKKDFEWDRCWSLALLTNQDPQLLDLLLRHYPLQSGYLNLFFRQAHMGFYNAQPIQMGQAMVFTQLCQRLNRLTFFYKPGWNATAFVHFLSGLQTNKTLTKMEGITLPKLDEIDSEEEQTEVLNALADFLAHNTGLEELTFYLQESDVQVWRTWTQAIEKGLVTNKTLRSLKFDTHCGPQVRYCRTIWNARYDDQLGVHQLHPCLENFEWDDPHFAEILQHLPTNIQTLTISNTSPDDPKRIVPRSSESIAALLSKVPTLTELQIRGYFFDPLPIFKVLKTHSGLQSFVAMASYLAEDQREEMVNSQNLQACLEMIRESNLTLQQCSPWSIRDPVIQYHLDLNKFGRPQVRSATGVNALVDLLMQVQQPSNNNKTRDFSSASCLEVKEASMLYGLLREMPTLWCYQECSNQELLLVRTNSPVRTEESTVLAVHHYGCLPKRERKKKKSHKKPKIILWRPSAIRAKFYFL